jgi:hypothetical protein
MPEIFRANASFARRVSSAETTEVNCRPRTSPTRRCPAGLTHRMMPWRSIT